PPGRLCSGHWVAPDLPLSASWSSSARRRRKAPRLEKCLLSPSFFRLVDGLDNQADRWALDIVVLVELGADDSIAVQDKNNRPRYTVSAATFLILRVP